MLGDYYIETEDIKNVEEALDDIINASTPILEVDNECIIILSKFDCGRAVVLEYFDVDNGESVDYNELAKLVKEEYGYIIDEILEGAIEYCDTNGIPYHS